MAETISYFDTIAITGHRDFADPAALYRGLDRIGARQYYLGGAKGIDTEALKYIANTQPNSIRTVVVPNTISAQPYEARIAIKQYATNVIELKNTGIDRYFIRNEFIVDKADKTVAFYDFRGKGGTYQTIEYAMSKGKLLEVNPLVEYFERVMMERSLKENLEWVKKMREYKVSLPLIKQLLLKLMFRYYESSVQAFAEDLGYPGVKSLEQLWSF